MSESICVKVKNLRKLKYANIEDWESNPENLYVGRHMRIFIDKVRVFHVKGSKWGNPFSLKNYSLQECLKKYHDHLVHSGLISDLEELKGKTLGCWCDQQKCGDTIYCHAQLLVELLKEMNK
jgi:hypothetical protein